MKLRELLQRAKTVNDATSSYSPLDEAKLTAAIEFLRRSGAASTQVRYSDDEEPTVWMAVASYEDRGVEVAAGVHPLQALTRLCEQLADGGQCLHCGRACAFEPDDIGAMPMNELVCWYQFDPELKTYRRSCEGDP